MQRKDIASYICKVIEEEEEMEFILVCNQKITSTSIQKK